MASKPERTFGQICPNFLSSGVCLTEGCRYRHNVQFCAICRVVCMTEYAYNGHLKGKKHERGIKRIQGGDLTYCKLCDVVVPSPAVLPQHVRGRRHRQLLSENPEWRPGDTTSATIPADFVQCETCNMSFPSRFQARHQTSFAHKKRERFFTIQAAFEESDKDKHSIKVNGELDFGLIETDKADLIHKLELDIVLTARERVVVSEVRLSSSKSQTRTNSNFYLEYFELPCSLIMDTPERINVYFEPQGLSGRFNDRIEIVFQDRMLRNQFAITRTIKAVVGNSADFDLLKPSAPYKPLERVNLTKAADVTLVRGIRPPQLAKIEWAVVIPQSSPPETLKTLINSEHRGRIVDALKRIWLPPPPLRVDTYTRHFRVLLHVEELQMDKDIQYYRKTSVTMDPVAPNYHRLSVPGLAEKRPSIIVGDKILVQKTEDAGSTRWFEGYVHRIRQTDVDLRFNASFRPLKGQRYDVSFKVNRIPLRRMHQAIATAFSSDRVLFPTWAHTANQKRITEEKISVIRTVDRTIQSNPPQLRAVGTIIFMPPGSVPFIIFGPPGTGKTVTVVESIRQLLLTDSNVRILACAPSNSAADLLAERLISNMSPTQLFRLNAPSRPKDAMPKILLNYALVNAEETFSIPPLSELERYRVIVSTCVSASVTYGIGMTRGHFSHIFVDEAGQACEPEVMIPIKTMADNETNIILSGDPKQLGPIVRSSLASSFGLKTSYLDRLMSREIYDPQLGEGICYVKLTKNWRSHEAILRYPNEQFYRNDLVPHGDKIVTHSLLRSSEVVKQGFPIVFHGIVGKDLQEASSPSFFNPDEASVVKAYVERLRTDLRLRLKDSSIGVITPYHAQVMKIRALLKKSGYDGIKVGTVEEFQGQERRVIVISTVRSSIQHIEFDLKHTLGFVANPRRFNVAITRAQALLIIVGDPYVLSLDPLWRGFMNYAYLEGGWKGVKPDWDTKAPVTAEDYAPALREAAEKDIDAWMERTRTLILENSERLQEMDDEDAHVDRPWREAE